MVRKYQTEDGHAARICLSTNCRNLETGQLLKKMHIGYSYPASICHRAYSDSVRMWNEARSSACTALTVVATGRSGFLEWIEISSQLRFTEDISEENSYTGSHTGYLKFLAFCSTLTDKASVMHQSPSQGTGQLLLSVGSRRTAAQRWCLVSLFHFTGSCQRGDGMLPPSEHLFEVAVIIIHPWGTETDQSQVSHMILCHLLPPVLWFLVDFVIYQGSDCFWSAFNLLRQECLVWWWWFESDSLETSSEHLSERISCWPVAVLWAAVFSCAGLYGVVLNL